LFAPNFEFHILQRVVLLELTNNEAIGTITQVPKHTYNNLLCCPYSLPLSVCISEYHTAFKKKFQIYNDTVCVSLCKCNCLLYS